MKLFITILVIFFAGMGADLGTAFAGISATAVIRPVRKPLLRGNNIAISKCF